MSTIADNLIERSGDIDWPDGFKPDRADLFTHNAIVIGAALVALVSASQLDVRVALTVPWTDVSVDLDALRERTISGSAVLTLTEYVPIMTKPANHQRKEMSR
jgi:hypothetical protein